MQVNIKYKFYFLNHFCNYLFIINFFNLKKYLKGICKDVQQYNKEIKIFKMIFKKLFYVIILLIKSKNINNKYRNKSIYSFI